MTEIPKIKDNPEYALHLAQLEQVKLANEKLKLEIAEFKKRRPWYDIFIRFVPIITTLVAIAGFLWGVIQYQDEQVKNRAAQDIQSRREAETAEQEFMKPWIESQKETYLEALSAAATIANSKDAEKRTDAADEFWELYHGKMILVETKSVSGAMVAFGACLNDDGAICSKQKLNSLIHALASVMRESMAATGKMTYKEFVSNQFQYAP